MLLYLLWYYDESGPRDLVATLDQENVVNLANQFNSAGWFDRVNEPVIESLEKILKEKGKLIGIYPLMNGWGGLNLQIVELE